MSKLVVFKRWRIILPLLALVLFTMGTAGALYENRHIFHFRRYFYWSSIRLDSDPLNRQHKLDAAVPCTEDAKDCSSWDPEVVWVTPGPVARLLMLAGWPAFFLGKQTANSLGGLGVSQVWSFIMSMPVFIWAWFYSLGALIDRWRDLKSARTR